MKQVAIVGGGPAGLRAAEIVSAAGLKTTLYDGKRSVGRKFLVAGKGGFNITNTEELDSFVTRYSGPDQPSDFWPKALEKFDNKMIRGWAARLNVGTFEAKSGRVYPKALKAAPLLRAWVKRLRNQGVTFAVKHRLLRIEQGETPALFFATEEGEKRIDADAVVLALGGGSWPMTGSDGAWASLLGNQNIAVNPLSSANSGWECDWPEGFRKIAEAQPLKNIIAHAGEKQAVGELMITKYGLEGGPLYELGPAIRALSSPEVKIDFKPTFTAEKLIAKMESAKRHFLKEARLRWKLSEGACAIVEHLYGEPASAEQLAHLVKACPIPLTQSRPIEEAISSAGGVCWKELDQQLMLKKLPGIFIAGEMIDWEAPTGGYLMQGCFATGTCVGEAVVDWLRSS